jgi:uncharacterized protein (TIGR03435 family)
MGNHAGQTRKARRGRFLTMASVVVLAVVLLTGAAALLGAQSATNQSPSPTTRPPTPQWQIDAGGKMEFDVVSVKPDTAVPSRQTVSSNVPLGPEDAFNPTGGLLSATNFALAQYMIFAYKLTSSQFQSVVSQLPKWANAERFDIQARAAGNPTKDQFRLMIQALLADRFKLAIHYETRQLPVMVLILDKPGKLGPQIQAHSDDSSCSTSFSPAPGPVATIAGGFPQSCGALAGIPASTPGRVRFGARGVPMSMIATSISIPQLTGLDRPVLDKTGLTGKFDFVIEFTPQISGPLPPGANFKPDETGPTFLEALKEQLGLKLESQTGPVDVLVIDHVEELSPN